MYGTLVQFQTLPACAKIGPLKRYLIVVAAMAGCAAPAPQSAGLGGSSWQLVKFQGGDGALLRPDDKSKYTLAFAADGTFNARIDCNRGRGGWKSAGKGQLEFGAMAITRAQCPPGSLHDHLVKQMPFVRSYVIKEGHLFLSLMADGGIYEFEPMRPPGGPG